MQNRTDQTGIRPERHSGMTAGTGIASWQVEPCPTWCENQHADRDHLGDRDHGRQVAEIPMRLANPVNFGNEVDPAWLPPLWNVVLRQPEGGGRVTVHMYSDDVSPMIVVDLRPDEAEQLASALVEAVGIAR